MSRKNMHVEGEKEKHRGEMEGIPISMKKTRVFYLLV